ncbi:MAG: methyltransferase domain-containing protein [Armatimonadetes bacterium]|nr:methyltransferase domain-containing protein [Armatimonadota bacterium]
MDLDRSKKNLIAGVFGRAAPAYDRVGPRFFTFFGRLLAKHAGLRPGEHVLDVATGRGAVLFEAAARVGMKGHVVGVDLSEAMVAESARELTRQRLSNAEVRVMDAEHLTFPDASFDAVLCGFALFFFPRVERALREFHRVLRPGGRLAVSTWGGTDPKWSWVREVLKAYMTPVDLSTKALDTASELEAAVRGAGFARVQVVEENAEFVYADEEEWWATQWSHGSRASLERLDPTAVERFKQDVFKRMQPLKALDGYHRRFRVLYGLGVRMGDRLGVKTGR